MRDAEEEVKRTIRRANSEIFLLNGIEMRFKKGICTSWVFSAIYNQNN